LGAAGALVADPAGTYVSLASR
ncbi:MAG: hypothetical protein QOF44_3889, partial [Streptomyces sp.]|nr:hypothetical protein [Streptomyces sp.]